MKVMISSLVGALLSLWLLSFGLSILGFLSFVTSFNFSWYWVSLTECWASYSVKIFQQDLRRSRQSVGWWRPELSFEGNLPSRVSAGLSSAGWALQAHSQQPERSCQRRQVLSVSEISLVPYLDLRSDWLAGSQSLARVQTTPGWWQMVFVINNKVNICNQFTNTHSGNTPHTGTTKYVRTPRNCVESFSKLWLLISFIELYYQARRSSLIRYDLMTWCYKDTTFTADPAIRLIFSRVTRSDWRC